MDFNNLSDLEIQTFSRMTYLFKPFDPTGSDSENPLPLEEVISILKLSLITLRILENLFLLKLVLL